MDFCRYGIKLQNIMWSRASARVRFRNTVPTSRLRTRAKADYIADPEYRSFQE
jgi:hypothetical protein